jgi:putative RNA 2'-phosphotransferase
MSQLQKESVAMSYILRHGALYLEMYIDTQGWMFVAALITQMKKNFPSFTQAQIEQIVREDTKGRYSFNADMSKLRALQGHSIPKVKINYEKKFLLLLYTTELMKKDFLVSRKLVFSE